MHPWGAAMPGGGVEAAPERQRENRSAETQRFRKDGVSALRQSPRRMGKVQGPQQRRDQQ